WTFANILLPDSGTNEVASHGLVRFRIRPHLPVLPGTTIENTANIFFDFNPPVITEPSMLVAEFSTGVHGSEAHALMLSPNPTDGILVVQMDPGSVGTGVLHILAADGRTMSEHRINGPRAVLDVAALPSGFYTMEFLN